MSLPLFVRPAGFAPPTVGGGGNLTTNLISYWNLLSNANDSHGSNNLSASGTAPTFNGSYVQFSGSNALTIGDNASLSVGGVDFCFATWVWFDSLPSGFGTFLSKYTGGTNAEYDIYYVNGTNTLRFGVYNTGGTSANVLYTGVSSGTWYMIYGEYRASDNRIGISVNASTLATGTGISPVDSTSGFSLGREADGTSPIVGRMRYTGFWKNRLLTSAEILTLYNGGNGLPSSSL